MAAGIPPRMMVAVDTISEENNSVNGTLPNSSAGASICMWTSANSSAAWLNRPLIIPKNAMAT